MIRTNKLLNPISEAFARPALKPILLSQPHSFIEPHIFEEAKKIAFQMNNRETFTNTIILNKIDSRGQYRGYHGSSTKVIFDQAVRGQFDPRPYQPIYVDPRLHIALHYAATRSQYKMHPTLEPYEDLNEASYPAILEISSDITPQENSTLHSHLDLRTDFSFFPPESIVNIDAITVLHPRFPADAVNEDHHPSIYASMDSVSGNNITKQLIEESPYRSVLKRIIRKIHISYP